MLNLKLGSKNITSFYDLLGNKEDDMTYGLGYALSRSSVLLSLILKCYGLKNIDASLCTIHLQKFNSEDKGYTDIEIWYKEKRLLIIEAKKGWVLPTIDQLRKYKSRFIKSDFKPIVCVLSECSLEYAKRHLDKRFPYSSWNNIYKIIQQAKGKTNSIIEKNYLTEYSNYLSNLLTMDRNQSNWVYCVSLSSNKLENSDVSFIDIVNKYHKYFFPFGSGSGWPLEAPNYIAFRYNGILQSIHKVVDFKVNDNLNQSMPKVITSKKPDPHFILSLGPAIKPTHQVKNGKIWPNGRVWCMIDTLLTCNTVSEARDMSQSRNEVL